MQLEKYFRNLLAQKDDQKIVTHSLTTMTTTDNCPSYSYEDGRSLEPQNSKQKYKPSLRVNRKMHRNKHRRSQNKFKGRSIKKTRKVSSIPFQQYNSLRIMVPSVASNENASRVNENK